jgi:hypothetical protein
MSYSVSVDTFSRSRGLPFELLGLPHSIGQPARTAPPANGFPTDAIQLRRAKASQLNGSGSFRLCLYAIGKVSSGALQITPPFFSNLNVRSNYVPDIHKYRISEKGSGGQRKVICSKCPADTVFIIYDHAGVYLALRKEMAG